MYWYTFTSQHSYLELKIRSKEVVYQASTTSSSLVGGSSERTSQSFEIDIE